MTSFDGLLRTVTIQAARGASPYGMLRERSMLASCIMPTRGRRQFIARAVTGFLQQEDTDQVELVVLDDGPDPVADLVPKHPRIRYEYRASQGSLGEKRNALCRLARGTFILHWDDDDWYPVNRVRRQLEVFRNPHVTVSGSSTIYYLDPGTDTAFQYRYYGPRQFVTGNTLAYRRSQWSEFQFADVQIGEDVRFSRAVESGRLLDLRDPALCVATIHGGNTSPKRPVGRSWQRADVAAVRALMASGALMGPGASHERTLATEPPCVSCIMPTGDRRDAVGLALELYLSQDYPSRELVVVDGGTNPVEDLCASVPGVRYARVEPSLSIGARRNLACELAKGEIIAHWDDDDWYASQRLRRQVEPILTGRCDVTGLESRHTLVLSDQTFWSLTPALHRRMFVGDVHGGTLTYRRSYRDRGVRYPDVNLAEDAALLRALLRDGARLERVANEQLFVYVRHARNTWRFEAGRFLGAAGWVPSTRPEAMSEAMIQRYRDALLSATA